MHALEDINLIERNKSIVAPIPEELIARINRDMNKISEDNQFTSFDITDSYGINISTSASEISDKNIPNHILNPFDIIPENTKQSLNQQLENKTISLKDKWDLLYKKLLVLLKHKNKIWILVSNENEIEFYNQMLQILVKADYKKIKIKLRSKYDKLIINETKLKGFNDINLICV